MGHDLSMPCPPDCQMCARERSMEKQMMTTPGGSSALDLSSAKRVKEITGTGVPRSIAETGQVAEQTATASGGRSSPATGSGPDRTNPKDLIGVTKPALHLVPPALALWVSEVFKLSALEYGPYNWRQNAVRKSVYIDAIERHLLAIKDGQWFDPKSNKPHVAHIGANCAILLDASELGNLINDMQWSDGPAAAIITHLTETRDAEPYSR